MALEYVPNFGIFFGTYSELQVRRGSSVVCTPEKRDIDRVCTLVLGCIH